VCGPLCEFGVVFPCAAKVQSGCREPYLNETAFWESGTVPLTMMSLAEAG